MEGDKAALIYFVYSTGISIHSLRMEGDCCRRPRRYPDKYFNPLPPHGGRHRNHSNNTRHNDHFNPLPPHGGRRRKTCYEVFADLRFQSTPSAWRETAFGYGFKIQLFHFNPLPPHGGRLLDQCHAVRIIFISIHSLRMEGDQRLGKSPEPRNISIHSLRMEGDNRRQQPQAKASHFNPLPPHGGRLLPD